MDENKEKGGKKEFALIVLARHGIIKPGTEIEVVPKARLTEGVPPDSKIFLARIDDPSNLKKITWLGDGNTYSLTGLTLKLEKEHRLKLLRKHTSLLWRIVGQTESLWDQAYPLQGLLPAS